MIEPQPHVSALELDTLAIGGLAPARAADVRAHLASCARCRDDERQAAELRAEFGIRALRVRRPSRRWWFAPALAFAAVAVAVAAWRWPGAPPPIEQFAVKGDAAWVFANRGGRVFGVHDGTELAPGDQIRFMVSAGAARYLLVASVDGRGNATIYYPYQGTQSAELKRVIDGERVALPGSIVLDDAPGPERIYMLLSDVPIAAVLVRDQLHDIARGGAAAIRLTRTLALPAHAQASLVFEKGAP